MRNVFEYVENPVLKDILDRYEKASTPEELAAARQYQKEVQEGMSAESLEEFNEALIADHRRIIAAMDEDLADLRAEAMRSRLGDLPRAISLTYIAAQCGKSKAWLSQRLNGNIVNGKEAHFSLEEAKLVEETLHKLGHRLLKVALV